MELEHEASPYEAHVVCPPAEVVPVEVGPQLKADHPHRLARYASVTKGTRDVEGHCWSPLCEEVGWYLYHPDLLVLRVVLLLKGLKLDVADVLVQDPQLLRYRSTLPT